MNGRILLTKYVSKSKLILNPEHLIASAGKKHNYYERSYRIYNLMLFNTCPNICLFHVVKLIYFATGIQHLKIKDSGKKLYCDEKKFNITFILPTDVKMFGEIEKSANIIEW